MGKKNKNKNTPATPFTPFTPEDAPASFDNGPTEHHTLEVERRQSESSTSGFRTVFDATVSFLSRSRDSGSSITVHVDAGCTPSAGSGPLIDHPIPSSPAKDEVRELVSSDSTSETQELFSPAASVAALPKAKWITPEDATSAPEPVTQSTHAQSAWEVSAALNDSAEPTQDQDGSWETVEYKPKKQAYPNERPPHLENNARHDAQGCSQSSDNPPAEPAAPRLPPNLPAKPSTDASSYPPLALGNDQNLRKQSNSGFWQQNGHRDAFKKGKGGHINGKWAKEGDLIDKNFKLNKELECLQRDLQSVQQHLRAAQDTIRVGKGELQNLQGQKATLDRRRREAETRAGDLQHELQALKKQTAWDTRALQKELDDAKASKMTAEARTKAGDQISERMTAEVDGLMEKVKQLEVQAAFNKIGDGSVDVPVKLSGILKYLDDLSESLLDQLSPDYLESSMRKWRGDFNELPRSVSDFISLCQDVNAEMAVSLHYSISLLILCYIQCEIWDVTFHPVAPTCVEFDVELGETSAKVHAMYERLVEKEPYIKSSNWRVLTYQTLWDACVTKLGSGSLANTLDYMTKKHVEFVVNEFVPALVTSSPMRPLKYEAFRGKLYDIIRDVLQLKHEAQTLDARYEYFLEIPPPQLDNRRGLFHDSPISCKTPRYVRWEAGSDSKSTRVSKLQQEATYHTAGDAGWVAKTKKV